MIEEKDDSRLVACLIIGFLGAVLLVEVALAAFWVWSLTR